MREKKIKIVIGTDHRGYNLKEFLIKINNIAKKNIEWIDVGTFSKKRTDYPIYAKLAIEKLFKENIKYSILICGSGIGMSIAANRYSKIYAGLVLTKEMAKSAKEDDNVNVLVLAADYTTNEKAIEIIDSWLNAKFKSGRYKKRINMLS